MDKALKEVRPVKYSSAAVKILHFSMKPHTTCFKLHWHDRVEFIKVNKGQMLIQCCGNTLKLKAGEMALFPPKTVHGGSSETEEVAYDVLMFDLKMFLNQTDVCNHYFHAFLNGDAKFEHVISNGDTVDCVDKICNSVDQDSLEIIVLVYNLIALLFKNHLYKLDPKENAKIRPIIDYIEENYKLDISTKSISEKFGYSSEHFCRKFKESIGITPMSYLKIFRLEQALKMIKNNEHSISEIALECGFSDANYFTRCFRSHYGVPPKHYKNKGWL